MEVNPNKRLGYGNAGWAALVRHPFFRPIQWARLEQKTTIPPFQPATENNFDLTYDLEELLLEESPLTGQSIKRVKSRRNINDGSLTKQQRDMIMIEDKFKSFDFTIFEKYEGFKDPVTMTVGDPPEWVKPAFKGAEQGDILPIKRISTGQNQHDEYDQWHGPSRSASVSNIAAVSMATPTTTTSTMGKYDQSSDNWKRSSTGAIRKYNNNNLTNKESSTSLSEEYALSLQGIRKKQSTKSFIERRERDRKSIQVVHNNNNNNNS